MTSNKLIKFLTLLLAIFATTEIFASVARQESAESYLRWNLFTPKQTLVVEKKGSKIYLKTLDIKIYQELVKDLRSFKLNSNYIKSTKFLESNNVDNVSTIVIELANSDVELFTFYRDREKKHVLDFWSENNEKAIVETTTKNVNKKKIKKVAKIRKKKSNKLPPIVSRVKATKKIRVIGQPTAKNKGYRDYRYGASLLWDYPGFGPKIERLIDTVTKTPEFFYPIKNRNYTKSEKEAHLQLTINLYRKKKYGLMYKSIKLFHEKFGEDTESEFNEYIKANAIIRDHIDGGNREPLKMAVNMLINISKKAKSYELKKAVMIYLLTYYLNHEENINGLKLSKQIYVTSKENFDYELSKYASESILYNLVRLDQVKKVDEVLKEKTISKLLPKQVMLAYQVYVNHKLGKMEDVLKLYESRKNSLANPIHPSILFNAGEAYFRLGQFEKSLKTFDKFLTSYSYHQFAGHARLRIATSYEILEKDVSKTLALYRNTINRTQNFDILTEAKFRYVALRSVRKIELSKDDKEIRIFLEIDKNRKLNKKLKKLLWLVRLRTLINDKKYKDALSYLSALPLISLKPSERRVFDSDGAEIVYGLILKNYEKAEYSRALRVWSLYKSKYITKVANDPLMNFIVGQSYLKLGLFEGFEKVYADFKKLSGTPIRSFPVWISRGTEEKKDDVIIELSVIKHIKSKNWELARRRVKDLEKVKPKYNRVNYYEGLINFKNKDYMTAAKSFEVFLSQQKKRTIFDPQDLAELITSYTDSLYELNLLDKYRKVSDAILSDTKSYAPSNLFMSELRERLEYFNVEILGGKATPASYLQLEPKIKSFLGKYPKTIYKGRLNYLLGVSFIKNKKKNKGKKIFEDILQDEKLSNYIKELARSELSMLNIREKTL